MPLYVITYASIAEDGQEVSAEPIAIRLTLAEAMACCKERAEQMADNLGGHVLVRDRQCLVEVPDRKHGHAPEHVFTLYEIDDLPERFHFVEKTGFLSEAMEMVRQFHRHVGTPIAETPCLLSSVETTAQDLCNRIWGLSQVATKTAAEHGDPFAARMALALEELAEWAAAHANGNLVSAADAWGDRAYVLFGDAVATGLPVDELFVEIHKSNMTKIPGGPIGKGEKGPDYQPPNIRTIIQQTRRI